MKILQLGALALACLAIVVTSVAMLIGRLAPTSPAAATIASVLPLAEVHARAARRAMAAKDWTGAERETRAELAVSPVRDEAWLRLAQIDVGRHGRLGPAGLDALQRAYDAAPYDTSPSRARRRFVTQHEVELPPSLHAQVVEESSAFGH